MNLEFDTFDGIVQPADGHSHLHPGDSSSHMVQHKLVTVMAADRLTEAFILINQQAI